VTVRHLSFMKRSKGTFVKNCLIRNEIKWQMFRFIHPPQSNQFIAATGAIIGQHHLAVTRVIPATVGNFFLVMVVLVFHLVKTAATGMIGSPFWGAPTGVAIADALPGNVKG